MAGATTSPDFPTPGALQRVKRDGDDAFVTKLSAPGSALLYSTYLGGDDDDIATAIAVDGTGQAYVAGRATPHLFLPAWSFPTTMSAFQRASARGACRGPGVFFPASDAFVARLDATGSSFVCSAYLTGNGNSGANSIAVDTVRSAYVIGFTQSSNFPTTSNAFKPERGAGPVQPPFLQCAGRSSPAGVENYVTILGENSSFSDDLMVGGHIATAGT